MPLFLSWRLCRVEFIRNDCERKMSKRQACGQTGRLTDKQIRDALQKNPVVTDEVASKVPVVDWQPDRQNTRSKKEADMQMRTKDSLGASPSTDRQTWKRVVRCAGSSVQLLFRESWHRRRGVTGEPRCRPAVPRVRLALTLPVE